jgi:pyruvate/2-oxoglutarate dehydrogenase complex dihydrolipoamide dehydrogenase (E3) component
VFRFFRKTHALCAIAGIIKIIADSVTDEVSGVHAIGPHASEPVHQRILDFKAGLKVKPVSDMICSMLVRSFRSQFLRPWRMLMEIASI